MAGFWKMVGGGFLITGGLVASFFTGPIGIAGLATTGVGTGLLTTGYNEKLAKDRYTKAEKKALEEANLRAKIDFVGMLGHSATRSTFLRAGIRKCEKQHEQFSKFGLEGSRYKSAKAVKELSSSRRNHFYGSKAA